MGRKAGLIEELADGAEESGEAVTFPMKSEFRDLPITRAS
jgi:hypothetical protein